MIKVDGFQFMETNVRKVRVKIGLGIEDHIFSTEEELDLFIDNIIKARAWIAESEGATDGQA